MTGEPVGFLLSEVDLARFGVLDPRIIRSVTGHVSNFQTCTVERFSAGDAATGGRR